MERTNIAEGGPREGQTLEAAPWRRREGQTSVLLRGGQTLVLAHQV